MPWYYQGKDSTSLTSTGLWTLGRGNKPKVVNAPDWWLNKLPKGVPVHGELWVGDDLQAVKSICGQGLTGRYDDRWFKVVLMAYNVKPYCLWTGWEQFSDKALPQFVPNRRFDKRMEGLSIFASGSESLSIVPFSTVKGPETLADWKQSVRGNGWEGFCLANPAGVYEPFRSHNLLKWKPDFETEGTVFAYEDGKTGKNLGRLGAVWCKVKWDEKILTITGGKPQHVNKSIAVKVSGWSDEEREWGWIRENYPVGSELKFSFKGVSNDGVPQSANVWRG